MVNLHDIEVFSKDYLLFADFFNFFCGKSCGYGTARNVYEYNLNKSWVIKIVNGADNIENITEHMMWSNINGRYPSVSKFMAPVITLSSGGKVLIQEKTEPIDRDKLYRGEYKRLPKMIPAIFTDVKTANWGFIGNRLVCHDYANNTLFSGNKIEKMKPLKFWDN